MIVRRARRILFTAVVGLLAAGARPASAQNLLTNPGFDGNATGWMLFGPAVFDPANDVAGNPASGSAQGAYTLTTGNSTGVVLQCVTPVTPGASWTLGASVLFSAPNGSAGSGAGLLATQGFSDAGCSTPIGVPAFSNFPAQTNGIWQSHSFGGTVPVGVQSMLIGVGGIATTNGGDFVENVDNVDFVSSAAVPTMSEVWLTLLAIACALVVLVVQQRRGRIVNS
jgi:hypothetical protein